VPYTINTLDTAQYRLKSADDKFDSIEKTLNDFIKCFNSFIEDIKKLTVYVKLSRTDQKHIDEAYGKFIDDLNTMLKKYKDSLQFLQDNHIKRINEILAEERSRLKNYTDGYYVHGNWDVAWLLVTVASIIIVVGVITGNATIFFLGK
jgi:septation ring formation regulator EzrA